MENREVLNTAKFIENLNVKFVVRLWDGFDNCWIDITKPISLFEAREKWVENTRNGTRKANPTEKEYYDIFPVKTEDITHSKVYFYETPCSSFNDKIKEKPWEYALYGMYRIVLSGREFKCYKNGKEWKDLTGDALVLMMCSRLQELEDQLKTHLKSP